MAKLVSFRHRASDASIIMNETPFKILDDLRSEKIRGVDDPPNAKMRKGIELEPKARELHEIEFGVKVHPLCIQSKG